MLSKWIHFWICIFQLTFFHRSITIDGSNDASLTIKNILDFYNKADGAYFQPTTISLLSQFLTIKKDIGWIFLLKFTGLTDKLKNLPRGQNLEKEFNLAIRTDTIRQIYNLFSLIELKSVQWFWSFARSQGLTSLDKLFENGEIDLQPQFIIYKINLWMDLFKNVESWGVPLNDDETAMKNFFQKQMNEFRTQADLSEKDEIKIFDKNQKKVAFNEQLFKDVNAKLPDVLVRNKKDEEELRKNYKQLFTNTHKIFFQTIRDNKKGDNKIIFDLTKLEYEKLVLLQGNLINPTFSKLNNFFPKRIALLKDIKENLGDSLNAEKISIYESIQYLIGVIVDIMFFVDEDFMLTILNQRHEKLYNEFIKKLLEKTIPNLLKSTKVKEIGSKLICLDNIKQLEMLVFYKNLIEVPIDEKNYSKASVLFNEIVIEFNTTIIDAIKKTDDWKNKPHKDIGSDNNVISIDTAIPKIELRIDESLKTIVPAEKKTLSLLGSISAFFITRFKALKEFVVRIWNGSETKPTPGSIETRKTIESSQVLQPTLNPQAITG